MLLQQAANAEVFGGKAIQTAVFRQWVCAASAVASSFEDAGWCGIKVGVDDALK